MSNLIICKFFQILKQKKFVAFQQSATSRKQTRKFRDWNHDNVPKCQYFSELQNETRLLLFLVVVWNLQKFGISREPRQGVNRREKELNLKKKRDAMTRHQNGIAPRSVTAGVAIVMQRFSYLELTLFGFVLPYCLSNLETATEEQISGIFNSPFVKHSFSWVSRDRSERTGGTKTRDSLNRKWQKIRFYALSPKSLQL